MTTLRPVSAEAEPSGPDATSPTRQLPQDGIETRVAVLQALREFKLVGGRIAYTLPEDTKETPGSAAVLTYPTVQDMPDLADKLAMAERLMAAKKKPATPLQLVG